MKYSVLTSFVIMTKKLFFLCVVGFSLVNSVQAASSLNLEQCYELALKHSAEVAVSEEDIQQARARAMQTIGAITPQIAAIGTEVLQDTQGLTTGSSSGNTGSIRTSQFSGALNATLPLFQGFKEVSALKMSRNDKALQNASLQNAKRLLFLDVVQAYYTVVSLDKSIARTEAMQHVYHKRWSDLRDRFTLGKIRESEAVSQETESAILTAELEKYRGERAAAVEGMVFLTGLRPLPPLLASNTEKTMASLDDYLHQATRRVDVTVAQKTWEMAQNQKGIARSKLLPSMDVSANYYPYRTGYYKDVDWDTTLNMRMPIFDLGSVGVLKESSSQARQAKLRLDDQKRIVESDVRTNYARYLAANAVAIQYQKAADKAAQSYQLMKTDEQHGLINSLDILQAEKTWLDTMRLRDEAEIQKEVQWVSLQVSAGILP